MRIFVFLFSFWFLFSSLQVPGKVNYDEPLVDFLLEYLGIKYNKIQFNKFIYVAVKRQRLYLIENGQIVQTFDVSTSKKGIGSGTGTNCTPAGLHEIADKVGEGLPLNSVLKNKIPTGENAQIEMSSVSTGLDLITTRILHLRGLENNVNAGPGKDSFERGIFIHGTHEEGLLGTAASKGCVRMANEEVIELFNSVEVGTFVVILNN